MDKEDWKFMMEELKHLNKVGKVVAFPLFGFIFIFGVILTFLFCKDD